MTKPRNPIRPNGVPAYFLGRPVAMYRLRYIVRGRTSVRDDDGSRLKGR
ncbi:MAG TPA: hypothetical protein VIQ02_05800 [Jiangellaceae bacterium]